jgi:hypothetical protein
MWHHAGMQLGALGFIPSWQFDPDPANNPQLNAFMPDPSGLSGLRGLGQDDGSSSSSSATTVMPDGTIVMPDGTAVAADGTATAPDGTTVAPDGTVIAPDGTVVAAPTAAPAAAPAAVPPPSASMQSEITGFLVNNPRPTSSDITSFLKLYRGHDRLCVAHALVAQGIDPHMVAGALRFLGVTASLPGLAWGALSLAAIAAAGFHGVRRHNGSWGWGVWWMAMGGLFPIATSVIAVAQGFGKPRVPA